MFCSVRIQDRPLHKGKPHRTYEAVSTPPHPVRGSPPPPGRTRPLPKMKVPMSSAREANAIATKQLELRETLWPGHDPFLWNRKINKGFATIPKTMPLILKIMDELTKGAPVSSTYLTLWCQTWDNSYAPIAKPLEMALSSGFSGQRGEHTWVGRMKKLQELHFIDIKAGKSGPMSHVIVWNPHLIIRYHHDVAKTAGMTEATYTSLIERAMDLGARDMLVPLAPGMKPSPEGPVPHLVALREEILAAEIAAAAATAAATPTAAAALSPAPSASEAPDATVAAAVPSGQTMLPI